MTEQERFEKWADSAGLSVNRQGNGYLFPETDNSWHGWQAAIESKAEVRPISLCETCYNSCKKLGVSVCANHIKSKAEPKQTAIDRLRDVLSIYCQPTLYDMCDAILELDSRVKGIENDSKC